MGIDAVIGDASKIGLDNEVETRGRLAYAYMACVYDRWGRAAWVSECRQMKASGL